MYIPTRLSALMSLAALAACGGGGSDENNSNGPRFQSWNTNANGTVIKDAANESFGVEIQSSTVVHIGRDTRLNDLLVNSNAQVVANGTLIGAVVLVASTNGSQIAVFKCNNGTVMRIDISSNGYSHNCNAPAPAPAPSPSPSPSPAPAPAPAPSPAPSPRPPAQPANGCLQIGVHASGAVTVTNTCNVKLEYSYCTLSGYWACRAAPASHSPSGYSYDRGQSSISPGSTQVLPESRGAGHIWTQACVWPGLPTIVSFDTRTLTRNSNGTGMCR